jgi:hypothetical protein
MASQWYLKTDDSETGPISFADLVELVRSEDVSHSDLVRPEWKSEWQRADNVVGLFYQARRSPIPVAPPEAPPVESADQSVLESEDLPPFEESPPPPSPNQQPAWLQQLLQFGRRPIPSTTTQKPIGESIESSGVDSSVGESPVEDNGEEMPAGVAGNRDWDFDMSPSSAGSAGSGWSDTVQAALDRSDSRESKAQSRNSSGGVRGLFGRVGKSKLGVGFRLLLSIVCAVLVVREVERGSRLEALHSQRMQFLFERQADAGLRHRPPPFVADQRLFPLIGHCQFSTYLTLLIGLGVATGVGVYGTAKLLTAKLMAWSLSEWPDSRSRSVA